MIKLFIPLLTLCCFTGCTMANTTESLSDIPATPARPEYFNQKEILYKDKVYQDNIKTAMLYNSNSELAPPIIAINTEEYLTLRFDDTDNNVKSFNYSLIHCNADWNPSGLMEIEYLDGYFQGNITNYDYSFNTLLPYIHYTVDFPNSGTKITVPGNYILFVYENNDKENPVLTRRFMVYEPRVNITYEYKRPDDVEERNYKQEIDFSVFTNNLTLNNGFSDLKVFILQNYRWDNCLANLTPKFIRSNELVYNLDEPQTFQGLNEFRHVNLTSTQIKSNRILVLGHDSTLYNALLYRDEKRSYKKYSTQGDINGRLKIQRDNSNGESHTQADYMWVTFNLDQNTPVLEGDLYLFGLFTDWEVRPEYKMEYSSSLGMYLKTIKLKQGNYDYMYVMLPKNKNTPDNTYIEGTHFDTENQYTILVYYRDIKRNADILIGLQDFNNVNRN